LDTDGRSVGMLGQGNWLYLRSETARGQLQLRWGESERERCRLDYDTGDAPPAPLLRLQAQCLSAGIDGRRHAERRGTAIYPPSFEEGKK